MAREDVVVPKEVVENYFSGVAGIEVLTWRIMTMTMTMTTMKQRFAARHLRLRRCY